MQKPSPIIKTPHPSAPSSPTTTDATNSQTQQPQPVNLQKRKEDVDPTRYGDWELNGRCIDF